MSLMQLFVIAKLKIGAQPRGQGWNPVMIFQVDVSVLD